MSEIENRIIRLEEEIAHQGLLLEELNLIIAKQRDETDVLTRRVEMLMQRAAEKEADELSSTQIADQRPPHY